MNLRCTIPVALSLILVAGCESPGPHQTAKQEASQRWNEVRANVKARLASEQLTVGATDKAAHEIAAARQLDPENDNLKLIEARVLLADGRIDIADAVLSGIEEPQPEVSYLRGIIAQQQLRWEQAVDHFLDALDANPSDVTYLTASAQVLLQLGQADAAEALLAVHADAHQWTPAYQLVLAECNEQLNKWDAAANAWQRVLHEAPDVVTSERLALALERAGRYREAVVTLEAALVDAERADQIRLRLGLARSAAELEDFDSARRELQTILARHPGHLGAIQALAEVFVREGKLDEALPLALTALEKDPRNVPLLELAAACAHRLEENRMAQALAQRLMAADPASPVGQQLLAR